MIYSVRGELVLSDPLAQIAVVECAGVGYKLTVSTHTMARLPETGREVRLYTYMKVSEDAVELFGFFAKEEADMFRLLISVSGVGPKAAISILSQFTPDKFAFAVAAEDTKAIAQTPGIGPKTAARVVLELKDKLAKEFAAVTKEVVSAERIAVSMPTDSTKMKDAQDALAVLGYSRTEIVSALSKVDMAKPLEDVIRLALAVLARQ